MKIKVISIGLLALFSLGAIFFYQQAAFLDDKFHIVFCDVGQGDGIFLRTPKGFDILVDGGPDDTILSCLSGHMPFWDREIDLVILTHPHADHLIGLIGVIKNYRVSSFASEKLVNDTASFRELLRIIKENNIKSRDLTSGDKIKTRDGLILQIVGPTQEFLNRTSPEGKIGESREFASLETQVSFGSFTALLTGDSQVEELKEALLGYLNTIDVLQVPHHGSKTGLDGEFLDLVKPKLAVISVGKNNRYGHPASQILEILRDIDIKILRTDQSGDIEIISDGKTWWVQ